jgi:hypothetical protein
MTVHNADQQVFKHKLVCILSSPSQIAVFTYPNVFTNTIIESAKNSRNVWIPITQTGNDPPRKHLHASNFHLLIFARLELTRHSQLAAFPEERLSQLW